MTPPSWAGRSRVAGATASAASSPTISPMAGSHTITPWNGGQRGGADGQPGEEAEGGAEFHRLISSSFERSHFGENTHGSINKRVEEHRARAFAETQPQIQVSGGY